MTMKMVNPVYKLHQLVFNTGDGNMECFKLVNRNYVLRHPVTASLVKFY